MNFIRSVVRAAVELGVLTEMPVLPRAPGPGKKLPRAPSLEDVEVTLRHSRGWVRAAIVLGFLAGLRCGELRALQVRDVLFEENVLMVRRAFSENELADSPKDKEERVIPLAPRVREVLAQVAARKGSRDFVVVNSRGKVPSRQAVWLAIREAQKRAGIERPFGVHALRHHFCSELARRGVSVEVVRALAGHGDLRTTQRYLHAARPELHAAISRLV